MGINALLPPILSAQGDTHGEIPEDKISKKKRPKWAKISQK